MGTKGWIIFVGIAVVVLGGLIVFSQKDRVDVSALNVGGVIVQEDSNAISDRVFGNKDSKVVLIEYGDYQCPGCKTAYPTVKKVSEKYKDQIAFVFRNLPLTSAHPNARAAAAAAEAAGQQGKFWEMHNLLYERKADWEKTTGSERTDVFRALAGELGLDIDKFISDMASPAVNRKIDTDTALAKRIDAEGTPTFTLGDQKIAEQDWNGETALDGFIRKKLTEAGIALPQETPAQ